MNHSENKVIKDFLAPFIGLPVWGSQKGIGSFLTFNLGTPILVKGQPKIQKTFGKSEIPFPGNTYKTRSISIKGEYFIWIFCCDWKITIDEHEIAHNESKDKEVINGVDFIDGQIIEKISLDCQKLSGTIEFDLGGKISFWNNQYYEPDTELIRFNNGNQWLSLDNLEYLTLSQEQKNQAVMKHKPEEIIILTV